jgi:hypothetical protein
MVLCGDLYRANPPSWSVFWVQVAFLGDRAFTGVFVRQRAANLTQGSQSRAW